MSESSPEVDPLREALSDADLGLSKTDVVAGIRSALRVDSNGRVRYRS